MKAFSFYIINKKSKMSREEKYFSIIFIGKFIERDEISMQELRKRQTESR